MKVKCIKIVHAITKETQKTSPWITIGKEYIVLGMEIRKDEVSYLINSDHNNRPGLQNAIQFEVTSKKIPSNWHIDPGMVELIFLGPKAWCEDYFWDNCDNNDPDALEIYRRELALILAEEGYYD